MTALKARDVDGFLRSPGGDIIVALIYGPEQGLVHERATRLAKQVAEDLADPWRSISLSEQEASDAARLTDEAAAQSFLGGRRVIRVRAAGAGVTGAVGSLLKAADAGTLPSAGLVVVEAGDLKKSSALRKACESSARAAAIGCYPEGERDMMGAIRQQLADEAITISDEAMTMLLATLGDDRGVLRQELEKLVLYCGPKAARDGEPYEVTMDDVARCLVGAPQEDSFSIASLALSGRPKGLSEALAAAQEAGMSVVSLLRMTQTRIQRLLPAAAAIAQGEAAGAAMKRMKPPVFFKEQEETLRQLKAWPLRRLEWAAEEVYRAEAACKRTGAPDQSIAERALLRLAAVGRR
ncbi:MAG: DNA polymerase III subunit delta [Pseudomonadota bacterium]